MSHGLWTVVVVGGGEGGGQWNGASESIDYSEYVDCITQDHSF